MRRHTSYQQLAHSEYPVRRHLVWAVFPNLGALDTLSGIFLCFGGCPGSSRMSSSIPGLCPLDASSTPPLSCDNQQCLCQRSEGVEPPPVENHWTTAYKAPGSKSDYMEDSTTSCHLTLGRALKFSVPQLAHL